MNQFVTHFCVSMPHIRTIQRNYSLIPLDVYIFLVIRCDVPFSLDDAVHQPGFSALPPNEVYCGSATEKPDKNGNPTGTFKTYPPKCVKGTCKEKPNLKGTFSCIKIQPPPPPPPPPSGPQKCTRDFDCPVDYWCNYNNECEQQEYNNSHLGI